MCLKNLKAKLVLFFLLLVSAGPLSAQSKAVPKTGAEQLDKVMPLLKGKKVALLVNQTSVVGPRKVHLLDTLLASGIRVHKIFAPEHGFRGNADAGETINNSVDKRTGVPVVSLYGSNKKPAAGQLRDIDIVVFDIQDVGARFYTYVSTMAYAMEACAENGKEFLVLDRPNPCDYVDGPVLREAYKSFVGMFPVPVLHGCTVGEFARMIKGEKWINEAGACRLSVVRVLNWQHGQPYSLPVKPSPNLPNDRAIALYPSLCPFEATGISVGRGTTFPFQVTGAPDKRYGTFTFKPVSLPGFDKNPLHKNRICYGTDMRKIPPTKGFTLKYLLDFYKKSGQKAAFFTNPRWFDQLIGNSSVRQAILKGADEAEIRKGWSKELDEYKKRREKYLLYP